ncbi:MAG: hypothetical protein ACU841_07545 [Gammaproteobacteria bacterium]
MNLNQFRNRIGQFAKEKPIDTLCILMFALLVVILSSLYFRVDFDDEHWEEFKARHHCQIRTTKFGTQRASWVCDDGKTYFRWRQQR